MSRHASTAPCCPTLSGCFRVHLTLAAHPLYDARALHVRYTPIARTPARPPARPHTLLAQVRLIQRALLGEETRDEALEETKLVTPIKKKEGGRHVHQPVDEGGSNALSSTTARQPTSLVSSSGPASFALGAALHTPRRRARALQISTSRLWFYRQRACPSFRLIPACCPTGRRGGSGPRDRHFQEEEAAGAV